MYPPKVHQVFTVHKLFSLQQCIIMYPSKVHQVFTVHKLFSLQQCICTNLKYIKCSHTQTLQSTAVHKQGLTDLSVVCPAFTHTSPSMHICQLTNLLWNAEAGQLLALEVGGGEPDSLPHAGDVRQHLAGIQFLDNMHPLSQ